jgi:dihydropteroate synthase-like protein
MRYDGEMPAERILFVTGKLAEPSLRRVVAALPEPAGSEYRIAVLGITVAALMHVDWLLRKLDDVSGVDRVILPGWCQGDIGILTRHFGVPFERGPKDLFDLPEYFGSGRRETMPLTEYNIEILAEINHAPRMTDGEIVRRAADFRDSGADVIDLGCIPGESWARAGEVTRLLRNDGHRVSIDSLERSEVETAVAAGAELVLSCNGSNVAWAADLNAELVAIPDDPDDLGSLAETIDRLTDSACRFRIDPILTPIGFGFAASLAGYVTARERWPDVDMMMGIGNLTELTEVDSAGVNLLLAAVCEELRIRSVLTTEVINWARSSVKELDIARRLAFHAVEYAVLPKHLHGGLVMLRDPKVNEPGEQAIAELAGRITDPNFRILVNAGEIHVLNRDGHWHGTDPYQLFDEFAAASGPLAASHAFYLGYELSKARTALTLGKQYTQDESLRWGFLTVPEISAHDRRRS